MSLKSLKYLEHKKANHFHNLIYIDNSLDQNLIEKLDLKSLDKAKNKLDRPKPQHLNEKNSLK